jgi:hypothetical protein
MFGIHYNIVLQSGIKYFDKKFVKICILKFIAVNSSTYTDRYNVTGWLPAGHIIKLCIMYSSGLLFVLIQLYTEVCTDCDIIKIHTLCYVRTYYKVNFTWVKNCFFNMSWAFFLLLIQISLTPGCLMRTCLCTTSCVVFVSVRCLLRNKRGLLATARKSSRSY